MKKLNLNSRLVSIAAIYLIISTLFVGRMLYLQVSGQDYYTMSTPAKTYTRKVTLAAHRGSIYDRNGIALVENKYSYSVSLDYNTRPRDDSELNSFILAVSSIAKSIGEENTLTQPRSSLNVTSTPTGLLFSYPDGFLSSSRGRKYSKLVSELGVGDGSTVTEEAAALLEYFGITNSEYDKKTKETTTYYNYTYDVSATLFTTRLDMYLSGFSSVEPYTVAEDVSVRFITSLEEKYTRGFIIETFSERVYNFPGYASHILGRVERISPDNAEHYTSLGYALDAYVGSSGAEYAFEEDLRGIDGVITVTEDEYGNVIGVEVTKEPTAGHDVYLTIDIEMQMTAERALAENIAAIRAEADPDKPLSGEDASAGALTAIDVNTSEILAICSYPTYNLATYKEDLAIISKEEVSPLFNRALSGTYAPGSTFKVGVAVAALTEGTVDEDTIIDTKGEYKYYEAANFTPRCWLYLMSGLSHGPIGIVDAIRDSCNYFFYEVGRLLTIEKMNEYCRHFGLGQPTGIELNEKTGILAGPDYRNDNGLDKWSPGDTLQAAIGQSDNLFTPLQISNYIATVLKSGTRHSAHLLYKVEDYATGEVIRTVEPEVLDKIDISDEILSIVKEGMKGVMDNGSAASVFSGYEIPVGGKTGTAQVSAKKSDNGIMTAFAPFDNPEIAVTCVIEQASGGTQAGYAVRDVFDYYFGIDEKPGGGNEGDTTEEDGGQ